MSVTQNAAYQGAIQGIFDGRGIQGLDLAADYAVQIAGANAFAVQLAAVFTADSITLTTIDEEILLAGICAAATEGRPFVDGTLTLPNTYFALATSIEELYSLAVANLGAGVIIPPAPPPGVGGFAAFFALMPGDNSATVAVGAPVEFPQTGPASATPIVTRVDNFSFTLLNTGTYAVSWQVSVTEAGQLQLAIGGAGLPDTVTGRATGTDQISGNTIITATAGQVLSLINPAGNSTALTITPTAGGTHSVSATLNIRQIA